MQTRMVREILALLLSVAVATPAPAFALNPKYEKPAAPVDLEQEQAPIAIFEPVQTADGQHAYLALAPVEVSQEAAVVSELATHKDHSTFFIVNGPNDPVAKTVSAVHGSEMPSQHSVTYTSDELPILNRKGVTAAVKEKIKTKIDAINQRLREAKAGLIGALVYSSAMGGISTFYFSSGVPTGLQTFGVVLLAYSMIALKPQAWGRYLDAPGKLAQAVLTHFVGELGSASRHVLKVGGATFATWVFNSTMVAFTFFMSGQLESLAQVAYFGFLGSYGVVDPAVLKKAQQGRITQQTVDRYYAFQFWAGTLLELLGIANFGYVQAMLATMTSMGIFYMLTENENGEQLIIPKMKTFGGRIVFPKFAAVGRLTLGKSKDQAKGKANCESRLVGAMATKGRRIMIPEEDKQ